MPKKPKLGKGANPDDGVWIAPRLNMKGPEGDRAYENRPGGPPNSSRLLELADIALGLKKPSPKKKQPTVVHEKTKTEPRSS